MPVSEKVLNAIKDAKSLDELKMLAKDNKVDLNDEQIGRIFEKYHPTGELTEEDLTNVSGGCAKDIPEERSCDNWAWTNNPNKKRPDTVGDTFLITLINQLVITVYMVTLHLARAVLQAGGIAVIN